MEKSNYSRRVVTLSIIFVSVIAVAHFAIEPVFSQNYVTLTNYQTHIDLHATTSTSFLTYVTVQFSSSSSFVTDITVLFTTSTSFITFVYVTMTNSTSTTTYPAPAQFAPRLTGENSKSYFSSILYAFFAVWAGIRAKTLYTVTRRSLRRR